MKMISDTHAFNNQAAQTILEGKLDNLMKAIEDLKKKDTGTPENGNTKLCKVLSVSALYNNCNAVDVYTGV